MRIGPCSNLSACLFVVLAMVCALVSACSGPGNYACGCVTGRVEWGTIGGIAPTGETSALDKCNAFTHQRTIPGSPEAACQQPINDCEKTIAAEDVRRSVGHSDVQAAISAAPIIYGENLVPVDGTLFRMQIQSAVIDIGATPCTSAGCKPVPAGVDALAVLLQKLTKQELARAPCNGAFPPAN